MKRAIKKIYPGENVIEGAGVALHRAFGYYEAGQFDPYLMMDDFRSNNPKDYIRGFPEHPHRGIETITYVIRGQVEHGDSLGNKGVIGAGDMQWMRAGSGIIHEEMPKGDKDGGQGGIQLWANLPAKLKMSDPLYRSITADQIPVVSLANGGSVKVIAGKFGNVAGPVQDKNINPTYFDVTLGSGGVFTHTVKRGDTAFLYALEGEGTAGDVPLHNRTLALFDDGDELEVHSGPNMLRFLLIAGTPLNEPIAWRGPIVMNTDEEIALAFDEYHRGTFLKHK